MLQSCKQLINDILKLNPVSSGYFYTLLNQSISKHSANLFEKEPPVSYLNQKTFMKFFMPWFF